MERNCLQRKRRCVNKATQRMIIQPMVDPRTEGGFPVEASQLLRVSSNPSNSNSSVSPSSYTLRQTQQYKINTTCPGPKTQPSTHHWTQVKEPTLTVLVKFLSYRWPGLGMAEGPDKTTTAIHEEDAKHARTQHGWRVYLNNNKFGTERKSKECPHTEDDNTKRIVLFDCFSPL